MSPKQPPRTGRDPLSNGEEITDDVPFAYLSLSERDREEMMDRLGISSFEQLETDIPERLRNEFEPRLASRSEQAVFHDHQHRSAQNRTVEELTCFLGGGLYDHFVPSTVMQLMTRGEFLTSYTPYQAEINQGTLQGMFEYQSMISSLMNLPVTNASMYDGATAFAEAVLMAVNQTDRDRVLYSPTLPASWIEVLQCYAEPLPWKLELLPVEDGCAVFPDSWGSEPPAAVCMAYPNRWGLADAVHEWSERRPDRDTVGIAGVNALAMGILSPPGDLDWDVAVAEGQPLGLPLQFGAPQLGLFSAGERFLRQMPGRLVGETEDRRGNRCYVLTLQTREQHIRRERATSNICTNHALLTLGVAVFLATMGPERFRRRALINHRRGGTLADAFESGGLEVLGCPVFNEVTVEVGTSEPSLNEKLAERGWMGGFWDENRYVCAATEQRTPQEIEDFAAEVADVLT